MKLLHLKDSIELSPKASGELYSKYINPGLYDIFKALGFGNMDIRSASGAEIMLEDGNKVLDFSSAIGILGLGHNHPRIILAEKVCHDRKLIDAIKVAPHKLQAALAFNLAQLLPEPLQISFFCVSGAEAVEGAMKLCEKAQGTSKTKFITTQGSYHGKTHGALSITKSGDFSNGFLVGIPEANIVTIPYGDIAELERAINCNKLARDDNSIIAMIVEPIQGQGIVVPYPGYLREVADLCRKNNILIIFDEVKSGIGRTGRFCAFQHENVVPDVVTLSKALGGGKRAISAFVTTENIFRKAYGKRQNAGLHSTTFGGLGESCAVAIETLNVLVEENLFEEAMLKGKYLKQRLEVLKNKYPTKIIEIRGKGLLVGIMFNYDDQKIRRLISGVNSPLIKTIDSVLIASIVSELYRKHRIITHFSSSDLGVLQVMPPLVVSYEQLDFFVDAIEKIIKSSYTKLLSNFILQNTVS